MIQTFFIAVLIAFVGEMILSGHIQLNIFNWNLTLTFNIFPKF